MNSADTNKNQVGQNQQSNTNLNQVTIQKGKDPLNAIKTKPNPSDSFVVNKGMDDSNLAIISFNTSKVGENQINSNHFQINQLSSNQKRESPNRFSIGQQISEKRESTSPIKQSKMSEQSNAIFSNYQQQNPFNYDQRNDNKYKSSANKNNNSFTQIPSNDQLEIKNNPQSTHSEKNQVKVLNLKGKDQQTLNAEQETMFMNLRNMKIDRDLIIKGEDLKASSDTSLKVGQYSIEGKLVLTNYKLVFVPNDENRYYQFVDRKEFQVIPLGFIHKLERTIEKKGLQYSYIDVICKDGRNYRFRYTPECQNQSFEMQIKIHTFAYPEDVRKLFCYSHCLYDRQIEDQFQGWGVFDIKAEFERQGLSIQPIDFNEKTQYDKDYANSPFKYLDNSLGSICSTYPPLIVVPSKMSYEEIIKCSKFRSRERLPAMNFAFKKKPNSNYTTMWRCAQCKPGINSNRSFEDESMLRIIGCLERGANVVKNVKIYDARPYLNAVGQQITGKGYEQKQFYKNCDIEFLDIHNIHKIRESYKKMCEASDAISKDYLKEVDKSEWFVHISTILEGTRRVMESLLNEVNVVIHCSDGWDRTSQLACLAQMCIDPYFRTIQGFEALIEKDWVQFGHQFLLRSGHGQKNFNDDQRAPIFVQFLDCVYQLTEQYPLSFEFNSKFLADIAYHYLSCRFGTFLYNSYQEQISNNARQQTISLWSFLNSQRVTYENPYYLSVHDTNISIIQPDGHVRRFSAWKDHFMIYQPGFSDIYKIYNECNFPEDNKHVLKRSSQMRYEQFREENKFLKKKIEELEAQLQGKQLNLEHQSSIQNKTENIQSQNSRKNTESQLYQNPMMQITRKTSEKNKEYQINVIESGNKNNNDNNNNNNNQQHLQQALQVQQEQQKNLLVSDNQLQERSSGYPSNQELDKAYIQDGSIEQAEDFGYLNQDEIERESNLNSNSKVDNTDKFEDSDKQDNELSNILNQDDDVQEQENSSYSQNISEGEKQINTN